MGANVGAAVLLRPGSRGRVGAAFRLAQGPEL